MYHCQGAHSFGWILEDVQPVEFIPCKGKLGLWNFDDKGATDYD